MMQFKATQVWTDQGTASAFVQSLAACESGPAPAAARSSPAACALWNAVPAERQFGDVIGDMISASRRQGQAPELGPPTIPLVNVCGGTPTDIVWVHDPCGGSPCPPPAAPQAMLKQLLDQIPMPTVTIEMSPAQRYGAITGMPSQFWAVAYDGAPIRWSGPTAGGGRVELVATPQAFTWGFGDGSSATASGPGVAWPSTAGAVVHVYTVKSANAGFATGPYATNRGFGGYPIALTVTFAVGYRIDGGSWQAGLPPIQRTVSTHYPVYDVRSYLVG